MASLVLKLIQVQHHNYAVLEGIKMNQKTNRLAGLVKTKSREETPAAPTATEPSDTSGKMRVNFMIDAPLLDKIDKNAKQRGNLGSN